MLFTKAFVVALTVRLSLLVGALELTQLARACLRLYQEAEAARTVQELEAATEHFGKALGGAARMEDDGSINQPVQISINKRAR